MSKKCCISGCNKLKKYGNGMCGMHWVRRYRKGIDQTIIRKKGEGSIYNTGYLYHTKNGKRKAEHVLIAEKAMGKELPKGVMVHHVNEDKLDNRSTNLVVCQNVSYHKLLHRRMDAINAGYLPHWRKCWVCKQYDDPDNLYINGQVGHKSCISKHNAKYYKRKKHERSL